VDVHYASSATKALIPATKVDGADTVLTQHGSTHDAGLDCDVQVDLVKDLDGVLGENASDGDKLGVSGAIQGPVRLVHASTNDLAVLDEDATNWCFIALQSELGLIG
jgi:hypothetical protein